MCPTTIEAKDFTEQITPQKGYVCAGMIGRNSFWNQRSYAGLRWIDGLTLNQRIRQKSDLLSCTQGQGHQGSQKKLSDCLRINAGQTCSRYNRRNAFRVSDLRACCAASANRAASSCAPELSGACEYAICAARYFGLDRK